MRRLLPVLAAVLLAALAWWSVGFVHRAEARLAGLPADVRTELARRHSRYVPLAQMAPALPLAAVAVEDRSFWTNPGISFEGVARAALVDVASQAWVEGGSTITQQLVRDRLLGYEKTLRRKAVEMAYAVLATRRFTKQTILTLYLNEVNYGHGAFGIAAAASTYFGTTPARLTLAQCALLAGLPQNPSGLDPLRHLEDARTRQRVVLQAMVQVGDITASQAQQAASAPLGLRAAA